MTSSTQPLPRYSHYIDGAWVDAAGSDTFDVLDPYNGGVYAKAAAGSGSDAERAVVAAQRAFPAWAELPPADKQRLFLRAADIMQSRRAELIEILARETGCARLFAERQQNGAQSTLRQAANWVYRPAGEVLRSDHPGTHSLAVRRPLGVVASFTPWNGANALGWNAIIFPIAAGNTVVVKPSEQAPISAGLVMAEIAEEAGFPPGVINVVTHAPGAAGPIADVFFDRPEVRCINFIGSARTARVLAERAGRVLKRSVLELGGYNPIVVLADADLDYAVRVVTFSAFFHQGQICMCARKVLVEQPIYEEFLTRLVQRVKNLALGDPLDPATVIGPLINDEAVRLVRERIDDAVNKGARVVTGGGSTGRLYEPTILVDVPSDARVDHEETFGPLLVVAPVEDADRAIELANRHPYGLTCSILTRDTFRGLELTARISAGSAHVNIPTIDAESQAPFGGVRDSGWGRTGPDSLADFTDLVWISAHNGQRSLPL